MFRFPKNDQYTSMALYTFFVLALLILVVVIGINLPWIAGHVAGLFSVLQSVLFGFVFAYIFNPLVRFAEKVILPRLKKRRRRTARFLALILAYLCVILILGILILMIVPQIAASYQDLSNNAQQYIDLLWQRLDEFIRQADWLGDYDSLSDFIQLEDVQNALRSFLSNLTAQIGLLSTRVLAFLGNTLIGIFLSAYFLYHKDLLAAIARRFICAFLPRRACLFLSDTLAFADRAFGRFLVGSIFDSLIVGLIAFIVLAIVKMPYYPLISAILCITNIIPAFGPIIGAVPSFFIIFIKDPSMALWFLVIALAIQQINGNIISPRILGSVIGLPSVWVITAIILMGAYFGPVGWFIGVPLFMVLYRVIGDLANRSLQKKGLPSSLSRYGSPQHIPNANQKNPSDEEESMP